MKDPFSDIDKALGVFDPETGTDKLKQGNTS